MVSELGEAKAKKLANDTETCWNLYAGYKQQKSDIKKQNGRSCGFCVPCIIRQIALPQETWIDLRDDAARNHLAYGRLFREYYGMLGRESKR